MNQSRIMLVAEINKALYYGFAFPKMQRASYLCDAILRYNISGPRFEKYAQSVDNFIAKIEKQF